MQKVLITDHPWPDVVIEEEILAAGGLKLVDAPDTEEGTLARMAVDVVALMTCWAPVTSRVLERAASCRHVARLGIGIDNIDVPSATERGMLVTRIPDYCVEELAEHALALLLALARNIGCYHEQTKAGRYDLNEGNTPLRVAGKTLGIIGFGRSGRRLAAMAGALRMRVLVHSRTQQAADTSAPSVEWRELDDLLAEADFVSIHCPLTEATRHLIDESRLRRMKRSAYLINTARGAIVESRALARALNEDWIAGAGLDVQDPEPPNVRSKPYNDPRVIVTPHAAFLSQEAVSELRRRVAVQVVDYYHGRVPENVMNPAVLGSRM